MYEKIQNYCVTLDNTIHKLEKELSNSGEGRLQCHVNGNHYKWFHEHDDGSESTYIRKKDRKKAGNLARKTYNEALLKDALFERHALEFYLAHESQMKHADSLLENDELRRLIARSPKTKIEELMAWANEDDSSTPEHPEHLTVKSASGRMVRSKSEAFIDWELNNHRIPYRYESELIIDGKVFHPDFIIRHPKTGDSFIWEHFGLMDNLSYARQAMSKLQIYYSVGYIPMINLIITSETSMQPLDSELVVWLIEHYFC